MKKKTSYSMEENTILISTQFTSPAAHWNSYGNLWSWLRAGTRVVGKGITYTLGSLLFCKHVHHSNIHLGGFMPRTMFCKSEHNHQYFISCCSSQIECTLWINCWIISQHLHKSQWINGSTLVGAIKGILAKKSRPVWSTAEQLANTSINPTESIGFSWD